MTVDFKCENPFCENFEKLREYRINSDSLNDIKCPKCKEKLTRIWSFSGGIKTSDGYKL